MTNILYIHVHRDASAAGSSAITEDIESAGAAAVPGTVEGLDARAALLSVIGTNCFACSVADEDDEKKEEVVEGIHLPRVSDVGIGENQKKEEKQKSVLGQIRNKPTWWRSMLASSSSSGISTVQNGESQKWEESKENLGMIFSPKDLLGELAAAGWPSWLTSFGAEAINGLTPRSLDSFKQLDYDDYPGSGPSFHQFEELHKIGQGSRCNVYKAIDTSTMKLVALKKVRIDPLRPETKTLQCVANEILTLRRLEHPNIIKLEGVALSEEQYGLYLVFQVMDYNLATGHAYERRKVAEYQVRHYMRQLLLGLEHCHSRRVLHGGINLSNLLIDKECCLKMTGFGSASFFHPDSKEPLTSAAWADGVNLDLCSVGCVMAELLTGKPFMPSWASSDQVMRVNADSAFKELPPSSLPLIKQLLAKDTVGCKTATAALKSEFFTTNS